MKRFMSYRVDFWLQFVVLVFTEIAVAHYLWKSIYENNPGQLYGGFTFSEMMAYYIFVPFINRIVKSNDDFSTSREIYEGGLTKYLLYPISFVSYKIIQRASFSILAIFQMAIGLIVIFSFFKFSVTPSFILMGLAACVASFLLYTFLSQCLEFVAFWADAVWSLGVMLRFITLILGGAIIPLTLFPEWAQDFLNWTPFPYLFSVPINAFLGKLSFEQLCVGVSITLLWTAPFYFLSRLIFSRGLRVYNGVGI